ncbi:MAG: hypothetical protein H0X46_09265 [Bacteroidetes bacterium]|nr:hypothetical protein [Bacteroidota bacterium]
MKKLITLSSFCLFCAALCAQTNNEDYYSGSKAKLLSKDRVSASISAGAGVSFLNSSKNPAYTSFIAPNIGYQLTEKFKLNIGLMHYTITGSSFRPLGQSDNFSNSSRKAISGNLIFTEGQYQLNKRTVLSGAVMVDANNYTNKNSNFKAASFGIDYKVSKHSSIGFKAIVSQGSPEYNFNPKTGRYNYNPMNQGAWGILTP